METITKMIQELRSFSKNKAGIQDCLNALNESGGDVEKAKDVLEKRGFIQHSKQIAGLRVPSDAPDEWAYVIGKVDYYLKHGADIYRKGDYFHMPMAEWNPDVLKDIESCFRQFAEGKGYIEGNPVENVSIPGVYSAINTLHFEVVDQMCKTPDKGEGFLDVMSIEHVVTKRKLDLFVQSMKVPVYLPERI